MERVLVALATLAVVLSIGSAVAGEAKKPQARAPGHLSATRKPPPKDVVPWSLLTAYEYQQGLEGLPPEVKALDGKKVTLRGYLLPLLEWDDIHEFMLVGNHMSCCFGMPAGISGQVQVVLGKKERGLFNTNEMLEVKGTFRVVETKDQGILVSIYRLDEAAARVVD
jgi:hypothetical protein